jgi:putative salt-induced outer membrane protein YdiY
MMSTSWIRSALMLIAVAVCASFAMAEDPPSSAWSPPNAEVLPVPGDSAPAVTADPVEDDEERADDAGELTGPWLLGDDLVETDESEWYVPTQWFRGTPWDTGIELGLNGSSGNNEAFSIRTGGYVKRESRFSKLDYSLYYNRTTTGEETTQDNATTDIRNDWLLDETSPWSLYAKANLFYDQFQSFDLQTNGSTGVGYQIYKGPPLSLTTRFGGGASREFGGPYNAWTPEGLLGFEYEQCISDKQKLTATLEYYPAFENVNEYRLVTDAGWEIELDKPSNLSLKISANDRYDSTPNEAEAHLVNYSVLLLLKL